MVRTERRDAGVIMVGSTLRASREHIRDLATENGSYYIVCARTGERPVPAAGKRFDSRATAAKALQATERYRRTLRQHDPQLPFYELIVCEDTSAEGPESLDAADRRRDDGSITSVWTSHEALAEFCRTITMSVLETLEEASDAAIERDPRNADRSDHRARTRSPDRCLSALERLAITLERRLTPGQRAEILAAAARRRSSAHACPRPLEATLSRLESIGLMTDYAVRQSYVDPDANSWRLTLQDYGLRRADGRIVTLPLTVELFAHRPGRNVSLCSTKTGGQIGGRGERLRLTIGDGNAPSGLVHAVETRKR